MLRPATRRPPEDSLRSESKVGKIATDEQLRKLASVIYSQAENNGNGGEGENGGPVEWEALMDKARAAGCRLDGALLGPSVGDLKSSATSKARKPTAEEAANDDDEDLSDTAKAKDEEKEKEKDKNKFLDEITINKAERVYVGKVDLLRTTMDQMDTSMSTALSEFRNAKLAKRLSVEMAVVVKRQKMASSCCTRQ